LRRRGRDVARDRPRVRFDRVLRRLDGLRPDRVPFRQVRIDRRFLPDAGGSGAAIGIINSTKAAACKAITPLMAVMRAGLGRSSSCPAAGRDGRVRAPWPCLRLSCDRSNARSPTVGLKAVRRPVSARVRRSRRG
jgi:hypothetical protein